MRSFWLSSRSLDHVSTCPAPPAQPAAGFASSVGSIHLGLILGSRPPYRLAVGRSHQLEPKVVHELVGKHHDILKVVRDAQAKQVVGGEIRAGRPLETFLVQT
ncbi:MAG: hypothetical protein INR71_00805 [Terriglobus roseus]|nr:hypothetical protein [Terriglobus roseus]